jgi:polyisoprenoid-binding protein YceI
MRITFKKIIIAGAVALTVPAVMADSLMAAPADNEPVSSTQVEVKNRTFFYSVSSRTGELQELKVEITYRKLAGYVEATYRVTNMSTGEVDEPVTRMKALSTWPNL